MNMPWCKRVHPTTSGSLTAVGIVMLALAGCQSSDASKMGGVAPLNRATYGDVLGAAVDSLSPDWARSNSTPGTLLSADETWLRDNAYDLAAPADEKINPWRRSIYMTPTEIRLGPVMAPEQRYYVAQSYKGPASEEARINVLIADLHRANARLDNYIAVADRILDLEEKRIEAIHDADLRLTDQRDLEKLLAHTIGNRHAIAFALNSLPGRISSYAYAAKRARIDLPGTADHFNIEAQIARMSHAHAHLSARIGTLDQQISDVLTLPIQQG